MTLICSIASSVADSGSVAFLPPDPESGSGRYRYVKRSRARIRDRGWENSDPGSGTRDKYPGSATLIASLHWFIGVKGVKIVNFLGQLCYSVLWIRICIKLKDRIRNRIHISIKVTSWIRIHIKVICRIRIRIDLQMTSQIVWNMSLFKYFFQDFEPLFGSLVRIRIRIKVKGRIQIRIRISIKVTSRIRINIKVTRCEDPDPHLSDKHDPDPHQGDADPQHWIIYRIDIFWKKYSLCLWAPLYASAYNPLSTHKYSVLGVMTGPCTLQPVSVHAVLLYRTLYLYFVTFLPVHFNKLNLNLPVVLITFTVLGFSISLSLSFIRNKYGSGSGYPGCQSGSAKNDRIQPYLDPQHHDPTSYFFFNKNGTVPTLFHIGT